VAKQLTVGFTPTVLPSNTYLRIWASGRLSPGAVALPDLYLMFTIKSTGIFPLSPRTFTTQWEARFGKVTKGTRVLVGVDTVTTKGVVSPMLLVTKIVT
jgi:hypothetical protein